MNGETFYLTRIPFETRQLADRTPLPATPNTLSVPAVTASYTCNVTVDGQPAEFVDPADATFTFGPADIGTVHRVDLRVPDALPDLDTDGDGMPDAAELLAGTDPHDPASVLKLYNELKPELIGGEFSGNVVVGQPCRSSRRDRRVWAA